MKNIIDSISDQGVVTVKFYDMMIIPPEWMNFTDIIMNITI